MTSVSATSNRLRSLDGLRGIAALVVVLHHCLLTWGPFATTLVVGSGGAPVGSTLWWITQSPLKLLSAGSEAVTIFFVLSGVVLTLPALGLRSFDWWGYYPRRLVRLYLPAIGAVILAVLLMWSLPHAASKAGTWWTIGATVPRPGISEFLAGADLLDGGSAIDNPMWSLRWEVLFSLLLPAVIGLALLSKRRPWLTILLAGVAIGIGVEFGDGPLTYLPVFVMGAVVAISLPAVRERITVTSKRRSSGVMLLVVFVVSILALILYWLVRPLADPHTFLIAGLRTISVFGAVSIVICAAVWAPFERLLTTRVVLWLGRISFSLYLVHVPILITYNTFLGPRLWWLSALLTVATALIVGELFARFIEQPAHRLSQRAGRYFSALIQREKYDDHTVAPTDTSGDRAP